MPKILNFKDTVEKVLEQYEESRNNDYILYYYVVQEMDTHPLHSLLDMSLEDALKAMNQGNLPSFDSITRLRRLVQEESAEDPLKQHLCGDRVGKENLANEVSCEIIDYKKQTKDGGNSTTQKEE